MRFNAKRIILVLAILLVTITLDQYTKSVAVDQLRGQPWQSYAGDLLRIGYAENEGAFLSLGANLPDGLRYWILTLAPVLILAALLWYTLFGSDLNRWQTIAFSFILGGGVSNIYDRLLYGKVVDFMNMGIGNLRTGIFNVADMAIMAGLFTLLPFLIRRQPRDKDPS